MRTQSFGSGRRVSVKQAIKGVYSVLYVGLDKQKYRSLLTEDYLLLENGELLDIEGDIAMVPTTHSGYRRTDAFDFRSVKVHGDTAYAVYFLKGAYLGVQCGRPLPDINRLATEC